MISKNYNIELKIAFAVLFFLVGISIAGTFLLYNYSLKKQVIFDEVWDTLIKILKDKIMKINNYLEGMEEEVMILQNSLEIKEFLKQDLIFDEFVIQNDVNRRARIITKEVENYIRAHPEMTLEDLQKNKKFQKIAIQPVGNDGYSALTDYGEQIIILHKFPEFLGKDLNNPNEILPELYELQEESKYNSDVSGFYDWEELDGEIRRKYLRFVHVNTRTADNVAIAVATTAYVSDYRIIKDMPLDSANYLKNFKENLNYHNLILVSPDGYVVYMVEPEEKLGTNLGWFVNLDYGLSRNYLDFSENNSFFGPYIGSYGDIYPKVSVMASIYEGNNLLGYVALVNEMESIFGITEEIKSVYETEEAYLVNDEQLLISPLRNRNFDILVQTIDTENARHCLSMESIEHLTHDAFSDSLNYRGDSTLGTHFPILRTHWCLLIEISKDEAINIPAREGITGKILISLLSISILSLIVLFSGKFIGKRGRK